MKVNQLPFILFILAAFFIIISPNIFSNGMFMDGLLYSVISNNLANGIGSFWNLHLTSNLCSTFNGHPPLAFGLQSLFFRAFGDSILIERIYSLLTVLSTGYITTLIWKNIALKQHKNIYWLPLLFLILVPIIDWTTSNNILENTMMIFTSLSILFIIKSYYKHSMIYLSLAGIMLFLGFMTKGFVALFPLSLLFWIFLFNRKTSLNKFIIHQLVFIVATILPFLFIYLFIPKGVDSLLLYFDNQVVGSLNNAQTVNNRFHILWRLFSELIPGLILMLLLYVVGKKQNTYPVKNPWVKVFIALGLSGSVPMMISLKQSGFYVLATFPVFAIAMALFVVPVVSVWTKKLTLNKKRYKTFSIISYFLVVLGLALMLFNANTIGRDKEQIEDIYSIIEIVPKHTIISIEPALKSEWSLHGYLYRFANISMDEFHPLEHQYLLLNKGSISPLKQGYSQTKLSLKKYELYKKNE